MTIALYATVFTLAYAVTVLLLRQAGDRGRQAISDRVSAHELAHARYSAPYGRTFEAVPTTPILLSDIHAIAERYICPICDVSRMDCTCYKSEGIN